MTDRTKDESALIVRTATQVSTIFDMLAELKPRWVEDHDLLVRAVQSGETVQKRLVELETRYTTRASVEDVKHVFEIVEGKADREEVKDIGDQVQTNTEHIAKNTRGILKYVVTGTGVVFSVVAGLAKIAGWW